MTRRTLFALIAFCVACFLGGSRAQATALFECAWTGVVQDITDDGANVSYRFLITGADENAYNICPQVGEFLAHSGEWTHTRLFVGDNVFATHIEVSGDLRIPILPQVESLQALVLVVTD